MISGGTSIEWADYTVNFWWGCQAVGPGCDNCYAEAWDHRLGGAHWGAHAPRRRIAGAAGKLASLQRRAPVLAERLGHRPRVFLHSMSDLFDNAVPEDWRREAWDGIAAARDLALMIVTKRIGNVEDMVPAAWRATWPAHVGLLCTVCDQAEADRDVPRLVGLKARLGLPWVGISAEPLLGAIDLTRPAGGRGLDWIIAGGESGSRARPPHPDWFRGLRDFAVPAGIAFLFKQWGEWAPGEVVPPERLKGICADATWFADDWIIGQTRMADPEDKWDCPADLYRIGKRAAGRLLDGRTWDQFPEGVK